MNIFQRAFSRKEYTKVLFESHAHKSDVWQRDDAPGYNFYLCITEVKRRKEEPFYRIEVPDYSYTDTNLLTAIWKVFCYLDNEGPGYSRLLDEYWRILQKGREVKCQTSQKSTPNETISSDRSGSHPLP